MMCKHPRGSGWYVTPTGVHVCSFEGRKDHPYFVWLSDDQADGPPDGKEAQWVLFEAIFVGDFPPGAHAFSLKVATATVEEAFDEGAGDGAEKDG